MIAALFIETGGCYATPPAFRDLLRALAAKKDAK